MITITQFRKTNATKPSNVLTKLDGAGFRDFALGLTHAVSAKKDTGSVFTLCEFGSEANRQHSNILAVTGIVLDLDGGNEPEQLMTAFDQLTPYAHVWYTTYQHTEEKPRLRIVVPLAQPITADAFVADSMALRLAAMLGLTVDATCANATQVYYLPTKATQSADYAIMVGESTALFDVALLPARVAKAGKVSSQTADDGKLPIYQELDAIEAAMFDGIKPMFFGGMFYVYANGVWNIVKPDNTFSKDIVEFYNEKVKPKEVAGWVNTMEMMWSVAKLPAPAINKITVFNGTWNTDTGNLETHDPKNFHSSGMAFGYDASATCPLWLATLDGVFRDDADKALKIEFLQEWFGYLMTPSTKYQVMLWLYGGGANGKSVITRMARELLGTDNVSSIPLAQLGARFIGAELQGKLANIVDEIATNGLMQEDELKKIVSGDPIQVERKNEKPFVFSPTARIFAATNTLPPSKDSTHGLDRRLIVMPCNRTFRPKEMDRDLVDKLIAELPGIFVWALEGHARLKAQDKFTDVPSSIAAMEDFKVCRNSVSLFKRDCLELPGLTDVDSGLSSKAFRVPSQELYRLYKAYCSANTYQAFGAEGFGKKLNELGVKQIRTGGKRYYLAKTVNLEEFGIGQERFKGPSGPSKTDIDDEFDGFAEAA